mmetsp:Transcript_16632/g.63008  ORF Transcript_16632/g.63008 Transcript_16632/m.63008 type:complete len:220 (+) Transcript_16632:2842-3501(+)
MLRDSMPTAQARRCLRVPSTSTSPEKWRYLSAVSRVTTSWLPDTDLITAVSSWSGPYSVGVSVMTSPARQSTCALRVMVVAPFSAVAARRVQGTLTGLPTISSRPTTASTLFPSHSLSWIMGAEGDVRVPRRMMRAERRYGVCSVPTRMRPRTSMLFARRVRSLSTANVSWPCTTRFPTSRSPSSRMWRCGGMNTSASAAGTTPSSQELAWDQGSTAAP